MAETSRKKTRVAGADRFSSMSDDLLQIILSYLDTNDVARTSLLSKRWRGTWRSFPIIDLDQVKFVENEATSDPFIRAMRNILATHDMTQVRKLKIHLISDHDEEVYSLVHDFITKIITNKKVQILDLKFSLSFLHLAQSCEGCYVLPTQIFSLGSSLVYLNLEGCRLGSYDVMKFWSLKTLSLKSTHMSEQFLFQMISASPSLETLVLETCSGLTTLWVRHISVRCLVVNKCSCLKALEIDAPNLQFFRCNMVKCVLTPLRSLEFNTNIAKSFPNLAHLYLSNLEMKEDVFTSVISRCTNLETFCIKGCLFHGRLRVVSKKLKIFEVNNCPVVGLMEVYSSCFESVIIKGIGNIRIKSYDGRGFCSLKALILSGWDNLRDDLLQELLSQSPNLHVLTLKSCHNFRKVDIFSQTLQRLVLKDCHLLTKGAIEAPKLEYFKYVGGAMDFSQVITSPHLDAEVIWICHTCFKGLECKDSHPINVRNLLRNFDQATTLTLGGKTPKHIIIPRDICPFPPFFYLRHLKVKTSLDGMSYSQLLQGVLHTSVCRETLRIDLDSSELQLKFEEVEDKEELECAIYGGSTHNCIGEHLVEARMINFIGEDEEMEMVKFLLGKATLLKTLLISLNREALSLEISSKIRNYRKASTSCAIEFI